MLTVFLSYNLFEEQTNETSNEPHYQPVAVSFFLSTKGPGPVAGLAEQNLLWTTASSMLCPTAYVE